MLHRTAGQQSLFCRRTTIDESGQRAQVVRDIEEDASAFAAELLMPRWLLLREHARAKGDIAELCRVFDSSNAAMERRIADSSAPEERTVTTHVIFRCCTHHAIWIFPPAREGRR